MDENRVEEDRVEEKPKKSAGRVAWGKKLAKMSKELKEAKKNGDNEIKLINKDIKIDRDTKNKLNSHHIEVMIGIGGLLVAIIALYLQYKNKQPVVINNNPQPQVYNNPQLYDNNPFNYVNNF
jgi:hypothetical protein